MKILNKFIWSKKEPSNKNDIWFDGSTWRMYTEEAWQSFTLPVDAADKVAKVIENASEVYQEKLNAGYGIIIEGDTISVDESILYDDSDVWEAIETLQQNKVEQIQLNDYVPLDRYASTSQVLMDNISELASIKLDKADVATINGQSLIEGGNIVIEGGESSHNIGSIDLFEQIIAQKQNHNLTLEDKEAILNGKVITTSVGEAVVPTISINSIEGLGHMLMFHFNERLYSMCVMWNDDRCYINGFFSFSVHSKLYADSELSETSENSVQNKVVTEKLAELSGKTYNFFSYTSEGNYAVFTELIGFKLKAGAKIVNKGETLLIIANNISLEGRYDLQPNQELILDSDKGYIGVGKDGGLVAFEYYYEPLAYANQQSISELREATSKEIEDVANEFNTIFTSVNLIDPSQVAYGKYIYQGKLASNDSYNTTGYIRVQEGESYALVATGGHTQANARFISFFDADKVWVSDGANYLKEVVIPSGVAYIRVSYDTLYWEVAQINIGNAVSYQPYKEIIDPALVDAKTLDLTFINKMSSFRGVATLGASQKIELQKNYVSRNVEVSGIIKGSIQSVEIGLGKGSFYGGYIELTPTHMYVFDGSSKVSEYEHGLTLGEKVFVSIRTAKEPNSYSNKTATIELRTQGQVFSKANIYYAGRGAAFIQNNGNSSVEVSLSFLPCYINAPIWMFGDSYFEWADKTRWIAQSIKNGNMNFLDCGLSGGTSGTLFTPFVNLLTIGLPKIAVWCLGMNDGNDSADAPSTLWMSNIKSFIAVCERNSITPVLATIPTVPSVNNEKKNEWVRNSGYRYIDFAAAVGATSSGQWDEGLLSADGVHPSEKGGIMLYAQALVDCPEIANS